MAKPVKLSSLPFEVIKGAPGKAGEPGEPGKPGEPGAPGKDGRDADIPIPSWDGTKLNWVIGELVVEGPDLQGPPGKPGESGGGGGGSTAQTQPLYATTVATGPISVGVESNRFVIGDAIGGVVDVTLPKAGPAKGLVYIIKKVDPSNNLVNVKTRTGEVIKYAEDETCLSLSEQGTSVMFTSDGTNWYAV